MSLTSRISTYSLGTPWKHFSTNPSKTGEISKASGRHISDSSHSSQELDGRISLSVPIEVLAVAMFETPESSLEKKNIPNLP